MGIEHAVLKCDSSLFAQTNCSAVLMFMLLIVCGIQRTIEVHVYSKALTKTFTLKYSSIVQSLTR